ncbi:MAG: C10 family peptidase [Muribaculaceae bacterium]|nr:C10 family peptidase [Muribaculaceae bacterium]
MKKISQRLLAAAVVVAAGASVQAEVLSPEQALGRALPQARRAAPSLSQPVLAYTAEADELPAVYVFAKENKGFMLVSADDAAAPLLGYADAGSFDAENMAPGLKYWIDEYARQIAYARENGVNEAPVRLARAARADVAPMVTTKWDQGAPYNALCPTYQGVALPTGCVATAASQIMKYHNWPEGQLEGKFSYTSTVQGVPTPLEINLENVTFDWSNMLDTYTATSGTAAQREAVALLMQVIGYGVDMNYAAAGSGAQTVKVSKILAENFGYDKSVTYVARDCYTLAQWEELIYNELAAQRPVLYDGSTVNREGHAFVCDGYREQDGQPYYHINWGWGGMSDGYFVLGALDPDSQGMGGAASGMAFMYNQDATIHIMKNEGGEGTPSFTAVGDGAGMVVTPGYFNLGREVTVSYDGGGYYNHSYAAAGTLNFGLHIVGEGQDFYRWSSTTLNDIQTNYGATSYNVRLDGLKQNSTYVITPAYRADGKIYEMGMPYGKVRAYVVKTHTYNGDLIPVGTGLEVTELSIPEQINRNQRVKMSATIVNNGDAYIYGHIAPVILSKEYGEYSVERMITNFTLNLDPAATETWEEEMRITSSFGLTDGEDYYFAIMDVDTESIVSSLVKFHYGTVSSGIEDVTVDTEAPAEYFNLQGVRVANPEAGRIYIVRRGDKATKELVK